jgi:hypothetical protein
MEKLLKLDNKPRASGKVDRIGRTARIHASETQDLPHFPDAPMVVKRTVLMA